MNRSGGDCGTRRQRRPPGERQPGLVRVFQLAAKLDQAIAVVDAGNVLVGIDPFRFPPRNRTRQLGDAVAALKHGGAEFNSASQGLQR